MAEAVGLQVRSLHRINFGGININNLKSPGDWKYLDENEMNIVQETVKKSIELNS